MCLVEDSRSKITENRVVEDVASIERPGSVDGELVIYAFSETRLTSFGVNEACKDGGFFIWKSALYIVQLDI